MLGVTGVMGGTQKVDKTTIYIGIVQKGCRRGMDRSLFSFDRSLFSENKSLLIFKKRLLISEKRLLIF